MIIVAHVMLYLVLLCIALSPHSVEADFSPWRDQEHERDMRKRKEASWREAEAEAEAVEEQPPAKKQKTWADGNLRAFVTKHAPPAAKIAASRKTGAYAPKKTIAKQPSRSVGRGASAHKRMERVRTA